MAASTAVVASVVGFGPTADANEEFTPGAGSALATLISPALNAGELSVYVKIGDATAGYLDETGAPRPRRSRSRCFLPVSAGVARAGLTALGPRLACPSPSS